MKHNATAFSSLKNRAASLGLALCLAAGSLGLALTAAEPARADETAPTGAEKTPERNEALPASLALGIAELPLNAAATTSTSCAGDGDYSMTFYYCEFVSYDDPTFDHPSGQRLLHSHTVTGLNLGDQLDTWDYVANIEGYFFFDAIPARPVVVEDESQNGVELRYMNPHLNEYTINYYRICDGEEPHGDAEPETETAHRATGENNDDSERLVETINGQKVAFDKIKSVTVDEQPCNIKVEGHSWAHELDDLMYLDSFPASIRLSTDPASNVINLVYADTMASLPDDTEVADKPENGSEPDSTPGETTPSTPDDSTTDGADDATDGDNPGNGSGDATGSDSDSSTDEDASDTVDTSANDADDDTNADDDTVVDDADNESSTTVLPADDATLPQTGDPLSASVASAAALAAMAAGAAAVARRQHRRVADRA